MSLTEAKTVWLRRRLLTLQAAAEAINALSIRPDKTELRAVLSQHALKSGYSGGAYFVSGLSVRRTSTMGEHKAALSWARAALTVVHRLEQHLEPRSIQHPPYSHPGDVA